MKVLRNTPEHLVLRALPPVEGIWLTLLLVVMIGSFVLALFQGPYDVAIPALALIIAFLGYHFVRLVNIDLIAFDREANTLEISKYSLLGRERVQHPLSDLGHATVDTRHALFPKRQRLALVLDEGMDAGKHIITRNHYVGQGAAAAAAVVNDWLSQPIDSRPPQA
ncbi:MAG: hypothetical protein AAFU41_01450 [Pseudomonadota bacterium]